MKLTSRPNRNPRGVRLAAWMLLVTLPLSSGCQRDSGDTPPSPNTTSQAPPSTPPTAARRSTPATPPAPAEEAPVVIREPHGQSGLVGEDLQTEVFPPEVLLSSGHQATCRLGVGDTFPDLPLTTLDGQPASLASQLGERLTVVVFWRGQQPMSAEQLRRLEAEFAERYRAAGVAVVAINVGDTPEEARALVEDFGGHVAHLSDPDGQAFAQVATELLPRTYLLRSDRQIVWLDLEYSRSMRRELRNAILYVLRQFEQQASSGSPALM
jgi:peroxiredoxin